jgi:hypothetical protein
MPLGDLDMPTGRIDHFNREVIVYVLVAAGGIFLLDNLS